MVCKAGCTTVFSVISDADTRVPSLSYPHITQARTSLGRTALCLSGGGSLAMYHTGVIKALLDEGEAV